MAATPRPGPLGLGDEVEVRRDACWGARGRGRITEACFEPLPEDELANSK